MTVERMRQLLDELLEALPPGIFDALNGGVILSEEAPRHPESRGAGLYILGQYHHQPLGLGRFISIYYGSFQRLYGGASEAEQLAALREVLHHELTHHLESLAGDRSLELQDWEDLERYRQGEL